MNPIDITKKLTFSEFMQFALYDSEHGYYAKKETVLGDRGDFVTAPLISPLFSKTLARQVSEVLQALPHADVLELGPGTGQMAADILLQLESLHTLPQNYYLIEISPTLRAKQQATLKKTCPHLYDLCQWIPTFPDTPFRGVILGNEFLDALPVERFLFKNNVFLQSRVSLNQNTWHETFEASHDPQFLNAMISLQEDLDAPLPAPYLSEVCLIMNEIIEKACHSLSEGILLFIDYGFGAKEYYHPDRREGTLMCHHQHLAHSDPFIHVGQQDITAHVNFTAVTKTALHHHCSLEGYTTQADFLMALGILDLAEADTVEKTLANAQVLKKLLMPHEMGELIKVMALAKNYTQPLSGFVKDVRHRL